MRERVCACLIVRDEQERLARALASVAFCDEIVVVDGGSTDASVELARAAGATVIENPWPGFAAQRNVALDAAGSEWALELDADERVTPKLRASIEALLAHPPAGVKMAVCARRNRFLGATLGPAAKYPEYRSRLFRRDAYRHDETRTVHEGIEPHERPAVLDGELEHDLAASLREALGDAWRYASLESRHIATPPNPLRYLAGVLLRPAAKVAYRTIVDRGWRDGWRGLVKIALDAGSDSLVWVIVLGRALGIVRRLPGPAPGGTQSSARTGTQSRTPARTQSPVPANVANAPAGHFGRRPAGSPKVVAIAARGAAAERARSWLAALQSGGADVTLICDGPPEEHGERWPGQTVPVRTLRRLGPLQTMRALDVEMQIRTIHALLAFGGRARLVRRLLPRTLRPGVPGLTAQLDARQAAELLRAPSVIPPGAPARSE